MFAQDTTLLKRIENMYKMRENFDPMFYLARRAYEGKHFVFWNRQLQKITEIPMRKSIYNQLPEISKQTDNLTNYLLGQELSFFIAPTKLSDEKAVNDSVNLSLLARDFYDQLRETTIFADYVHFAVLDNVSFIEVGSDDDKTIKYKQFEAFDIIFNPLIKNWADQKLVIKVIKKKKDEVMDSPLYTFNKEMPSGDANLYLGWKEIFEQEKYSTYARIEKDEMVLLEAHMLVPGEDGKEHLKIKTLTAGGGVIRDDDYPNIPLISIIPFRIYPGAWYQPSYVFRQIPNNRAIDVIANRMDDLFLRLAKGGWIKHEEENIDGGMNEETGQIINYSQRKPEQMQMPQVPGFFGTWFQTLLNLSERYGIQTPRPKGSGVRANAMIESIKGLTQEENTATLNSLRASIKQIMEVTMMWCYELWDTPQEVIYSDLTNSTPQFVSAKQKDIYADQSKSLIFIPNQFKRFDVDIDNAMGYTLAERQKNALQLYGIKDEQNKPLVSSRVLKQLFKLGATGYIMEGDEMKLYQTQEFQNLIKTVGTMQPQQKQALKIVLDMLAQQDMQKKNPHPAQTPAVPAEQQKGGGETPNATQ